MVVGNATSQLRIYLLLTWLAHLEEVHILQVLVTHYQFFIHWVQFLCFLKIFCGLLELFGCFISECSAEVSMSIPWVVIDYASEIFDCLIKEL